MVVKPRFDYTDLRFLYIACLATIAIVYSLFRLSQHWLDAKQTTVLSALQTIERQRDRVADFERQLAAGTASHYPPKIVDEHRSVMSLSEALAEACTQRPCAGLFQDLPPTSEVARYHQALSDGTELSIEIIRQKTLVTTIFDNVAYVSLLVLLFIQAVYIFKPAIRRMNDSLSVRSDFLSRISHEIRNPMNSILGMADILKGTRLNYEQGQYVDNLIRSGQALLDMLNNLIDFSSIEGGKLSLKPAPFDLFASLDRCINLISIPAHHRNLSVFLHIGPNVPPRLDGDSVRLEQVLINLLNNAIKFTESGHIILRVEQEQQSDKQTQLRFSVEDTGIGIKEEQLSEIFESFVQGDSSIQRRYGGSGLGLSISSELIRLMKGRLEVNSRHGHGSKFFFTIEFTRLSDEAPLLKLASRNFVFMSASAEMAPYEALFKDLGTNVALRFKPEDLATYIQQPHEDISELIIDDSIGIISMINCRNIAEAHALGDRSVALIRSNFTKENMDLLRRNGFTRFLIKPLKPWALTDLPTAQSDSASHSGHQSLIEKLREKRLRILLVDDSNDNLFLLKEVVQPLASIIHFAENGLEAIEKFSQQAYDVVLMDIQMPVMDGYTAIRKIREIERAQGLGAQVPIYAVTAHAGLVDAQKCREAGFTDRIVKPVIRSDIYQQLSKVFAVENLQMEESDGLQPVYIQRLIPTFLKTRFEDILKLKNALAASDFKTVAQLGHKIKGSAASYGFPVVSTTSQALELAAQAHDLERCHELAQNLEQMFLREKENRKLT